MMDHPPAEPASGPVEPLVKVLEIPANIRDAMVAHCRREAPLECCGLLGGRSGRVSTFHPLLNIAKSETRYLADPRQSVGAWVWLREHNLEILAIYHSHPRSEAVPSATDLRENYWGETPRIIVSLLTEPPTIRNWRLDAVRYEELSWSLIEPQPGQPSTLQPLHPPD